MSPEQPEDEAERFDRSSPLAVGRVLHRELQDGTGQDYYVYLPAEGALDAPVLVAIHDVDRDARAQADAFSAASEQHGVVLIAPHFASDRYPNYQRLGRSRIAVDERRSANEALDAILEEVASLCGAATERIQLFGSGGGARFAMRYAMLSPKRVAGAMLVEPGAYTFPDPSTRFPQGIAPSKKRPDFRPEPRQFLEVPMTLMEREGPLDRPHPHVEAVESDEHLSDDDSSPKGRQWVTAMVEAAEALGMPPRVTFMPVESQPSIGAEAPSETKSVALSPFAVSIDRVDNVFDVLVGETSPQPARAPGESRSGDAEESRSRWANLRRAAAWLLALCAVFAVVTPIVLWAQYRGAYVVSRDAVLRGHIAEVGAQLDGVVKSVHVDTGDEVVAGQVVARLEDRQIEAKRMRAASQLEKARRELEVEGLAIANERARLQSSLRGVSADLSAARAEMRAAESRAQEALRRLELQRSLAREGLVAEERVRAAETELRTARALAAASRAQSKSAVAGQDLAATDYDGLAVREKRVSVLESEIAALEAELRLAEANLDGAIIRAPDDGAVIRRIVEPGGSTVVGQPILSLWLGLDTWVEAWIDESQFGEIAVGSPATVTFKSHPNREFAGVVESMAVSTDIELPDSVVPQPRHERMRDEPVVSVRVKLDDSDATLFPGLSAVVAIRKKDR